MPSTAIQIVDSHTAGEPTRMVLQGGPNLGTGSMAERLRRFACDYDHYRSAIVNEPRGSDVIVGALLCEPEDPSSTAGVIYFNNVGYLGMCGHGTIGLIVSLAHLGRISPGEHRIETPVGIVKATLHPGGQVSVENVASYRHQAAVTIQVPGFDTVTGDIAWGGNWFFLLEKHPFELSLTNLETLTAFTWSVRNALRNQGITGANGEEIDHIELFSPSLVEGLHSRNFVLCPGKAYDRSPCGTGTSAKVACLYADNKLRPGELWRQEGILGTVFEASFQIRDEAVIPTITGSAFVTAESRLIFEPEDPFPHGIVL